MAQVRGALWAAHSSDSSVRNAHLHCEAFGRQLGMELRMPPQISHRIAAANFTMPSNTAVHRGKDWLRTSGQLHVRRAPTCYRRRCAVRLGFQPFELFRLIFRLEGGK